MKLIQRLLAKTEQKEMNYDETMGLLTKDDVKKLKEASRRPRNPDRKTTYKKWVCSACQSGYFYAVLKCPSCESSNVHTVEQQTNYAYANMGQI